MMRHVVAAHRRRARGRRPRHRRRFSAMLVRQLNVSPAPVVW
jgi:hypothetical protein